MRVNRIAFVVVMAAVMTITMSPVLAKAQTRPGDPWFGSWVNGPTTLTMTPWLDGLKLLETRTDSPNRVVAFGRMDGKVYPETGVAGWDGATFNRVDDRTYEYVGTKDGKVLSRVTVTFPLDGITRVSHVTISNGQPADRRTVWKRKQVPGPDPWFGTWRTGNSVLIMEPWEDGFEMSFVTVPSAPGGTVERGGAFARLDGRRYAETGNSSADYLVFKRIDARTISVTYVKDDKETTTGTISFPPDGRTRISRTTGRDASGAPVDRTTTWTRVEP